MLLESYHPVVALTTRRRSQVQGELRQGRQRRRTFQAGTWGWCKQSGGRTVDQIHECIYTYIYTHIYIYIYIHIYTYIYIHIYTYIYIYLYIMIIVYVGGIYIYIGCLYVCACVCVLTVQLIPKLLVQSPLALVLLTMPYLQYLGWSRNLPVYTNSWQC